ncbi:MAG: S8 family serine peptidase [Actinomycetota bacterium]|nr:S8 family serine peptidase [Actinomycetota bacterium]
MNTFNGMSDPMGGGLSQETTGRYLVLFEEGATKAGLKALTNTTGAKVASSADTKSGVFSAEELEQDSVLFDDLGVAVISAEPDQLQALAGDEAEQAAILAVEEERIVHALMVSESAASPPPATALSGDYLRGYRDAVLGLTASMEAGGSALALPQAPVTWDETQATWGLQASAVTGSSRTGKGVGVAVLDTGMDLKHPDFARRSIKSESFIAGQTAQDGHGHGTHCIGTALGPLQPGTLPRYGIAHAARIFAGKVLSNQGSGGDAGILNGILWAVKNKCRVVSMSLGAPTRPGQTFSAVFETAAGRAMKAGTLIIAAAGNDSRRSQGMPPAPVSHPANCPSIMAVAAIDDQLNVASFSNAGVNPSGGQIDIAGPGVRVRSSWPKPTLYNTINGTSMATPHVAGVAALLAEANPKATAAELWALLIRTARRLPLPASDVGAGFVQAP